MRILSFSIAALSATGCLSASTHTARREAEVQLARPAELLEESHAAPKGQARLEPVKAARPERAGAAKTCDELAREVARAHPRVLAMRERARAALARSSSEGSLPPPEATFEIWDFPIGDPSLADHQGMYMVGLGQEFPAAGSRDERARAAAEEARGELGELSRAAREIWTEVAFACADWSAAEALRQGLAGHRALIADMREAMLASYRAGSGSQVGVTRTDAELAAADRHVAEAEEEVSVAESTLRALSGRAARLPEAPPVLRESFDVPSVDTLTDLALASRGEVSAAAARQRSRSAAAKAAEAEASSPSFEVRATYMQTPSERAGLGAMVGMSLPWLWGGGGARSESARYELEAARADQDDVVRRIEGEVARAAGRLRAQRRSLALLREREIPAARRALESERAALAAGSFELATWIQAAHALREAHVEEARIRGAIERALSELEGAVGRPLSAATREREVGP